MLNFVWTNHVLEIILVLLNFQIEQNLCVIVKLCAL